MKNTFRKPYIYKVTNLETHRYYIGSQCSGKIVGENYFTSSHNKEFKDGFKTYREEKYKIEIIKEFEDPEKCVNAENYMIRDQMQLKDGLCLNRSYFCNGKKVFSRVGTHHSEETRKRMSLSHKGHPAWNKGRPSPNKGIPRSEETKKKISIAHKIKISIEGNVFDSLAEAAKYYNVHITTISHWAKNKKGHPTPRRIKISIEGMVFDSITEASKYYNKGKETIRNWVKKNQHNAVYVEK